MSWTNYVIIAGWLGGSIYMIGMGVLMVFKPEYRNYIARLWFRSEDEKGNNMDKASIKFVFGPLYIFGGLSFIALGLYVLNVGSF
jgi:hypothetical protein